MGPEPPGGSSPALGRPGVRARVLFGRALAVPSTIVRGCILILSGLFASVTSLGSLPAVALWSSMCHIGRGNPARISRSSRQTFQRLAVVFGTLTAVLVAATVALGAPAPFTGRCRAPYSQFLTPTELGSYRQELVQRPSRSTAVRTPDFFGRCSIRIQVHPGDLDRHDDVDRDEITGTQTTWRAGQSVWYSLSFMLGRNHPYPNPDGWMLVDQFFAQDLTRDISGGSHP